MQRSEQVTRGAWMGLLVQAADKILPVVIVLYLARAIDPESFGVYSFLVAYLALFQVAVEYSLDAVLVRVLSQQSEPSPATLHAGLGLKLLMSLAAAAVATLCVGPLSGGRVPLDLAACASLGLLTGLGGAYRSWFRSNLEIPPVLALASARALLLAVGVVVVVQAGAGLRAVFLVMAAANLVVFTGVALAVSRELKPRFVFDREQWSLLLRGAVPLFFNGFAIMLGLKAGQVLLLSMRGPVETGLLGAASRVAEAFSLLPEALMITVYPLMASLHIKSAGGAGGPADTRLEETVEKSTRYLLLAIAVPVTVCMVAGDLIMGLLFGAGYAEAGPALSLLAVMALLSATGTVVTYLLVSVHAEKTLYRNTMVFALLNVVLSYFFITRAGYMGAAVAMIASSAMSQVSLALLPPTRAYTRLCLAAALRPALAVACGVAAGLLAGYGSLAAVAWSVVACLLALLALRVLTAEDIAFIRSSLGWGQKS